MISPITKHVKASILGLPNFYSRHSGLCWLIIATLHILYVLLYLVCLMCFYTFLLFHNQFCFLLYPNLHKTLHWSMGLCSFRNTKTTQVSTEHKQVDVRDSQEGNKTLSSVLVCQHRGPECLSKPVTATDTVCTRVSFTGKPGLHASFSVDKPKLFICSIQNKFSLVFFPFLNTSQQLEK